MKKIILLLILLLVCGRSWAENYTQRADCKGAWLFTEGSGTVVDNAQGTATFDGSFESLGHPAWSSTTPKSYIPYSADFNASERDYIRTDSGNSFQMQKPMSTTAWIKVDSTSEENTIIGGDRQSSPFFFFVDTSNKLQVHKRNSVAIAQSIGTIGANFAHVGFTYDSSGNYVFYINGESSGTGTNSQDFTYVGICNHFIGGELQVGSEGAYSYMNGLIAEVGEFSSALDSTDISAIYDYGLTGASSAPSSHTTIIRNAIIRNAIIR